jgi:hypothetical protein
VETPVKLTEHQRKLLRELEESLKKGGAKHSPSGESWTDRLKSFFNWQPLPVVARPDRRGGPDPRPPGPQRLPAPAGARRLPRTGACHAGTRDLCAILLPDSGHLQEEDAAFANRHGFSKHTALRCRCTPAATRWTASSGFKPVAFTSL